MNKGFLMLLLAGLILTSCSLPGSGPGPTLIVPTQTLSQLAVPTLTPLPALSTILPLLTPTSTLFAQLPTETPGIPVTDGSTPGVNPGSASGPYAVVLVASNDVLNVRSGPGADKGLVGTLPYNTTGITRVGPWSQADDAMWVEIQSPSGVRGWVNADFLTEYVASSSVCDPKVLTLIGQFEQATTTTNGELLASLVSPVHGLDVWAYRSGRPINFDVEHVRWVFDSTFSHNWGTHPASGQEVTGAFHNAILPGLQEVFSASHTTTCNDTVISGFTNTWPQAYTNINVVKSYKPGSPGVDLDWRAWLVGTEYVGGKPYLFSIIQFIWVP